MVVLAFLLLPNEPNLNCDSNSPVQAVPTHFPIIFLQSAYITM